MTIKRSNLFIGIALVLLLGTLFGFYITNEGGLKRVFSISSSVYVTQDKTLGEKYQQAESTRLQWSELIPENEKAVLQKYQQSSPQTVTDFTNQILQSLQASTDEAYKSAMQSTNTVGDFNGKLVSIAAYIVPLDFDEQQNPRDIFIVPYFGACIHFPPPPPNQMIFARLDSSFENFDYTQAYFLTGVIQEQMFDDQLGTAAYALEVLKIRPYLSEPDDFRQH